MFDIFSTWREAVNLGFSGLTGDEVCAGYYRVRHFGVDCDEVMQDLRPFGPELDCKASDQPVSVPPPVSIGNVKGPAWLPVAIWWDEGEDRFICLVDGQEVAALPIWPHCRSHPVPYEAYVLVAEQGGAWPDGLIGGTCEDLTCSEPTAPSSGLTASKNAGQANFNVSDARSEKFVGLDDINGSSVQTGDTGLIVAVSASPHADHDLELGLKVDQAPALTGLGHNQAGFGQDVVLAEALSDLAHDCFSWLDGIGVIETQKQADQAGGFAERFARLEKEAEEARTFEKRPALERGRAIDAKWKPIVNAASDGKKRMKRALEPFLIAERERLEEEARLNGEMEGSAFANPKAGLHGRKISLRSSYVLTIHDEDALRDYFAGDKRFWRDKEVRQVFKRLAEADLHAGRNVPGAELVQELTAA